MRVSFKTVRAPRISPIRFTRNEMREVAEAVKDAETARIKSARKPDMTPAAPLKVTRRPNGAPRGYAIEKTRKTGRNKRDWVGIPRRNPEHMMDGLRVTVSSPDRGLIKFPSNVVKRAMIREVKDEMFAISRVGRTAGSTSAAKYIDKALKRAVK